MSRQVMLKLSDLDMLTKLVDCGKLLREELRKARTMYRDLISGCVGNFDQENHVWVQRLFYDLGLGGQQPKQVAASRKAGRKELLAALDAMPRPKPPGRA